MAPAITLHILVHTPPMENWTKNQTANPAAAGLKFAGNLFNTLGNIAGAPSTFWWEPTTKEIEPSPATGANRPCPAATKLTCPAIAPGVDSPQSR